MRIVAILATFNEERFIRGCIEHLLRHGVGVYLIDNASQDRTVALAERYLKRGLLGIESFPRAGTYDWRPILERKERLADELDADWFMHVDADEVRLPRRTDRTLAQEVAAADDLGFNAINFLEYAFVPTRESPDHDHPDYEKTMRRYYPFLPSFPHRLNAWKKQPQKVDLASSGGHLVHFPGVRMYPESFPMRHYLFLSVPHAVRKHVDKSYSPAELALGWHRARAGLRAEQIVLQSENELRRYTGDHELDPSNPLKKHPLFT
jgi:glycosyltransferase involved in cell wall biosynthesis